jgi:LysR family transcriptional regulator, carnitine catabolism transcriptional activator
MSPTLRQLEAFLAVARTLSFSKASEVVHLSQPGLSGAVRKLEDTVGARLFDRNTRNVVLTPAGTELLSMAEHLLTDLDFALERMRDYLGGKRGRVAVAAVPSIAAGFVPDVIAKFERAYPGITLQLHDALSEHCLEMLRSGRVDVALTPEKRGDPTLAHQQLFRDHLVLFCRADHPLAKQRTVTWTQIAPLKHIATRRTSSVRDAVDGAFAKVKQQVRPAFEVEHASTAIGLVASGLAVAVLPHSVIRQASLGPVVHRRITEPEIHRNICIVTLKSRSLPPAAEAFIQSCFEHQKTVKGASTLARKAPALRTAATAQIRRTAAPLSASNARSPKP